MFGIFNFNKQIIKSFNNETPKSGDLYKTGSGILNIINEIKKEELKFTQSIGKDYLLAFYLGALNMLMRGYLGADNLYKGKVRETDLAVFIEAKNGGINNKAELKDFLASMEQSVQRPDSLHFVNLGKMFCYNFLFNEDSSGLKESINDKNKLKKSIQLIFSSNKNVFYDSHSSQLESIVNGSL